MTEDHDKARAEGAARLRTFRLALGYKTAASFARILGYHPSQYRRYERVFFCNSGPLVLFVRALRDAGLDWIDLNWLVFGKPSSIGDPSPPQGWEGELRAILRAMPDWEKPAFMRLGIRLLNGVPSAKAQHLFRQEAVLEQARRAGRAEP